MEGSRRKLISELYSSNWSVVHRGTAVLIIGTDLLKLEFLSLLYLRWSPGGIFIMGCFFGGGLEENHLVA